MLPACFAPGPVAVLEQCYVCAQGIVRNTGMPSEIHGKPAHFEMLCIQPVLLHSSAPPDGLSCHCVKSKQTCMAHLVGIALREQNVKLSHQTSCSICVVVLRDPLKSDCRRTERSVLR